MPKSKPVVWTEVLIGGQHYRVIFANDKSYEHLDGCEGRIIYSDSIIAIDEEVADERADDTLFHEIIHALFEPFLGDDLRKQLKLTKKQWTDIEEKIALIIGTGIAGVLKGNKWLALPPKPARTAVEPLARPLAAAKRRRRTPRR